MLTFYLIIDVEETPEFFGARWRNVGVALLLLSFVGGVFAFTISGVSKDGKFMNCQKPSKLS